MNQKVNIDSNIIDVTIKEGGFRVHHHILAEQVENILRGLAESGIEYAEVSHGRGIGAKAAGYPGLHTDQELLAAARKGAPQMKLSAYLSTYPYSMEALAAVGDFFDIGRIGVNVQEVEKSFKLIQKLKRHNKSVIGQLIRVHSTDFSECSDAAKKLENEGADIIYISDSFGSLFPQDVRDYIAAIKSKVKVPIGFQGRNSLGMAIENSMVALDAGATWLDGSLMGMGQGAGVSSLEILVSLLQRQNKNSKIKLSDLGITSKFYTLPCFRSLPYSQRIDLALSSLKMDYYPQQVLEIISNILEKPLEGFLRELKEIRENPVQLQEKDIRKYLAGENLDFDVVMNFIQSGTIPVFEEDH